MVSTPPNPAPASVEESSLALLRRHTLFGGISLDQLRRLCAYAKTRKVRRGTTIFAKGDPGTALFAVRNGIVKISAPSPDGREAVFNLLHADEIFGEIALLDGQSRTADAIAVTDCELMAINRRDFLAFVQDEPKVALRLIELLCARLRFASEHLEEVVFMGLPARLARTLLRLAEDGNAPAQDKKLSITQRDISQMMGTTRESINKQLRAWAKNGWVEMRRGSIIVLNPQALGAVAGASAKDARPSAPSSSNDGGGAE
jgi:CRP/FNR family cyclic AMP-dependent transcriptional regulator